MSGFRLFGWVTLAAILMIGLTIGDILLGRVNDVSILREEARKFRSEVAYLMISSKSLIPNLNHNYLPNDRSIDEKLKLGQQPRKLRTDKKGLILSGNSIKENAVSILFLGGSTTESNEVDEIYRFPSVVERMLAKNGISARAYNAGVRGHTTLDSINALINRFRDTDANYIVLMHNINDRLRFALIGEDLAQLGKQGPTSFEAVVNAAEGLFINLWEFFLYRSNFLFWIKFDQNISSAWREHSNSGNVTERSIEFEDPNFEMNKLEFEKNLAIFIAITRSLNKIPVLMTQPLGKSSSSQEAFNSSIRSISNKYNVPLIDIDNSLKTYRDSAFLSDYIHFNNFGSQKIGEIVSRNFTKLIYGKTDVSSKSYETIHRSPQKIHRLINDCPIASKKSLKQYPYKLVQLISRQARYPSFSPDGRWLFFQYLDDKLNRIAAYDMKKKVFLELTPEEAEDHERHPVFLEQKGEKFKIIFGKGFMPNTSKIEKLMVRSWPDNTTKPLLPDDSLGGSIASVHKGGVTFAGYKKNGKDSIPSIFNFDLFGRIQRITDTGLENWRPVADNSGNIYFITRIKNNFDIQKFNFVTRKVEPFYTSPADEWDPAVSPDNKYMAFSSKRSGSWDIWLTSLVKPEVAIQVTNLAEDAWDPTFHPNGNILVFAATTRDGPRIFGTCFNRSLLLAK